MSNGLWHFHNMPSNFWIQLMIFLSAIEGAKRQPKSGVRLDRSKQIREYGWAGKRYWTQISR